MLKSFIYFLFILTLELTINKFCVIFMNDITKSIMLNNLKVYYFQVKQLKYDWHFFNKYIKSK